MKLPSRTASGVRRIVCSFCESGELVSLGGAFARCGSCRLPLVGSTLETLRDIVGLPDAVGSHACECGHPEMRRLPDGVFHCPECRAEVLPIRKPRPGSARFTARGPARFVPNGDPGVGRQGAKGARR
jgi:hypothetical protein